MGPTLLAQKTELPQLDKEKPRNFHSRKTVEKNSIPLWLPGGKS
jgi:hypothetical protein